jgi:uncharacterized membrane protein YuzA (DUF378 family)
MLGLFQEKTFLEERIIYGCLGSAGVVCLLLKKLERLTDEYKRS